jgi:hypothetical protein
MDAPKKDIYEFLLKADNYEMDRFDTKTRNRMRKSLNACTFRRPSLAELQAEGLALNRQTCERQHRREPTLTDQRLWNRHISLVHANGEFIILGAYLEGRMIGYLAAYQVEGTYNLLHAFIDRNHSSLSPMCGLLYTMINNLIREHGPVSVSYGMHKFSGPTPLNNFKKKMLFEMVPATKGYVINPVVLFFIRMAVFTSIGILKRKNLKYKWIRNLVHLYQGHRQVAAVLERQKAAMKDLRIEYGIQAGIQTGIQAGVQTGIQTGMA